MLIVYCDLCNPRDGFIPVCHLGPTHVKPGVIGFRYPQGHLDVFDGSRRNFGFRESRSHGSEVCSQV